MHISIARARPRSGPGFEGYAKAAAVARTGCTECGQPRLARGAARAVGWRGLGREGEAAERALRAQRPHTAAIGSALRKAAAATLVTLVAVHYLPWELGSMLRQHAGRNRQWVGSSARTGV